MCGQFAVLGSVKAIKDYYEFLKNSGFILDDDYYVFDHLSAASIPNENIKPMDSIPIITSSNERIKILSARWGLVPFWAKDDIIAHKTINARIETINEKPSYKYAYIYRRCLIPVTGFYEKDKNKNLYYFDVQKSNSSKNTQFKSFAGLYEIWGKDKLITFTIVTKQAEGDVKHVHNRMPVLLNEDEAANWLLKIA